MKVNNINVILFFLIITCIVYVVFFNNSTNIESFSNDKQNSQRLSQRLCSDKSLNESIYSYIISGNYTK
jgi:uncharacterized protein YpmS